MTDFDEGGLAYWQTAQPRVFMALERVLGPAETAAFEAVAEIFEDADE